VRSGETVEVADLADREALERILLSPDIGE
jgi:hypothetical protein